MVTYKLFANVNPLKRNELICVMDTFSLGAVDSTVARSEICKAASGLACKGYKVKVHEISDTLVEFIDFI